VEEFYSGALEALCDENSRQRSQCWRCSALVGTPSFIRHLLRERTGRHIVQIRNICFPRPSRSARQSEMRRRQFGINPSIDAVILSVYGRLVLRCPIARNPSQVLGCRFLLFPVEPTSLSSLTQSAHSGFISRSHAVRLASHALPIIHQYRRHHQLFASRCNKQHL